MHVRPWIRASRSRWESWLSRLWRSPAARTPRRRRPAPASVAALSRRARGGARATCRSRTRSSGSGCASRPCTSTSAPATCRSAAAARSRRARSTASPTSSARSPRRSCWTRAGSDRRHPPGRRRAVPSRAQPLASVGRRRVQDHEGRSGRRARRSRRGPRSRSASSTSSSSASPAPRRRRPPRTYFECNGDLQGLAAGLGRLLPPVDAAAGARDHRPAGRRLLPHPQGRPGQPLARGPDATSPGELNNFTWLKFRLDREQGRTRRSSSSSTRRASTRRAGSAATLSRSPGAPAARPARAPRS